MTLESLLSPFPRARLAALPTPIHPLARFSEALDGPELWIKRDDLTGLAGGGNKTRKLEFLVGDALETGADTLVTVGAIQSNHTRQTAAAAARVGLDCVLLHNGWAPDAGAQYRTVGNILLSELLGAQLYLDETKRGLDDAGQLHALVEHLRAQGRTPYLIPGGASDHPLGGLGYAQCAAEIVAQCAQLGVEFDYVVHCTGSSSTQAGLLAGFAVLGARTKVIGVSDDDERTDKAARVLRLANATLEKLGATQRVAASDVEVVIAEDTPYGIAGEETIEAIRLFARTEGLVADPVYEARTLRGLIDMAVRGRVRPGERVLVMHLGGSPALHAWNERIWQRGLVDLPFAHASSS